MFLWKSDLRQVSSSHAEGISKGSMLKNDSLLSVDIQNLIESRKKTPTVSWSVPKHE